jgi:predicted TIM-barrel fold metal-dependent hydrolase
MLSAIDVHVHVRTGDRRRQEESHFTAAKSYFKTNLAGLSPDQVAEYYQGLRMKAVIFDVDAETRTGLRISNDEIAGWVRKYPDTFIGFASVDPWKGRAAVLEAERCARDLGLRGLKFQTTTQAFFPNDPRFYPLWEKAQELGLICLFHMGTTGIGAGTPGGGGLKLKYSRPIPFVDDVAADFPQLTIVGAHPGWPWHSELLAVARHKSNVYVDLSGWAPRYFPSEVVHYANSLIRDRVLFGSDFPLLSPERWLQEFAELPFKDEVRPLILRDNAAKLLGIALA